MGNDRTSNNRSHSSSGTDSTKTSYTTSDNQNLARRYFSCSGDLACKKSAENIGGFNNCFIPSNICHGAQRIKLLTKRPALA